MTNEDLSIEAKQPTGNLDIFALRNEIIGNYHQYEMLMMVAKIIMGGTTQLLSTPSVQYNL
jgi:hypothetical protein